MVYPDWLDQDLFNEFIAMRKQKGKRFELTEAGIRIGIKKLSRLRDDGEDVDEVIEQSIFEKWQGFFPVKTHEKYRQFNTPINSSFREEDFSPSSIRARESRIRPPASDSRRLAGSTELQINNGQRNH